MAERQITTYHALKQWITAELQKCEGGEECEVIGMHRLVEADADGCNWSGPTLSSAGVPWEIFSQAVSDVIGRARAQFNLE